jgi:hypothetical protein
MSNPSKQKGTAAETELRLELLGRGIAVTRTPASSVVDLVRPGDASSDPFIVETLATRPDRGEWLLTMSLDTFAELVYEAPGAALFIEVKRYKKFALHTLFQGKFGRKA